MARVGRGWDDGGVVEVSKTRSQQQLLAPKKLKEEGQNKEKRIEILLFMK